MTEYVLYLLPGFALMFMSGHVMASSAEQLFNQRCACCHADQSALHIGASKIKKALTGDDIRAHYFKLNPDEVTQIVEYLGENK